MSQAFDHARKILAITPDELAKELAWQQGNGLLDIIHNTLFHLKKSSHPRSVRYSVELKGLADHIVSKQLKNQS